MVGRWVAHVPIKLLSESESEDAPIALALALRASRSAVQLTGRVTLPPYVQAE